VLDSYWNQNNVYLQAAVLDGEEISVRIEDMDKGIIVNEIFYTSVGVTFNMIGGKSYRIIAK
jgi:hypothetical protein